jgi:hypothetical protein
VTERQYANTACPYCQATLDPLPTATTACPACRRAIHVRSGPDGLTYLLENVDLPVLEQAWDESRPDQRWRRAAQKLKDAAGFEHLASEGRGLILAVALISVAVGMMIPVGMAIMSGAALPGTAGSARAEPATAAGKLLGGATPAPVSTPAPAAESGQTPAPTLAPTPPPAPKPTPDARRPRIIGRAPEPDAVSVVAGSAIKVLFSEPVKGVSGATIQLLNVAGGWVVRSRVRYDAASRTAALTPALHMYPGTEYRVEILSGITDRSGNRLKPARWTFRVAR